MRYKFLKFLTLLVFIALNSPLWASECYHYHTQTTNEIKVEDGSAFWVQTVKDPNGISIASYKKFPLKNVDTKNLHFVSENENGIIIANSEYYYWLDKNSFTFERTGLGKIIESKKVSATFGGNTFKIDGKWMQIDYNPYTNKASFTNIPKFPDNPEIIYHSENGGRNYLIKDKNNVYAYDETEKTLTTIPNLTPGKTKFYAVGWAYDNHFLYDDDTFYLIGINFDDPQDITPEFKTMELKHPFTKAKIINISGDNFLDFGDGDMWIYFKNGIGLKGDKSVHFYPVENAKYYPACNMILYDQKFYNTGWDLANSEYNEGYDTAVIKDKDKLKELFSPFFWDGENLYQLDYKPSKHFTVLPKSNKINYNNLEQKYNNAVSSYRKRLPPFVVDGSYMFNWNENYDDAQKETIIRSYQRIKDLKLAYLIDNELYIENNWVENIMDFDTAEFIGSTVEVVSGCDGGEGQNPVVVEYNYYFKDKNGVYLYHSDRKKMEKLNIANPQDYSENTFIELVLNNKNYG